MDVAELRPGFRPVYEGLTPLAQAVGLPRHLAGLQQMHLERQRVYEGVLLAIAMKASASVGEDDGETDGHDPRITFT